MKANYITQTGIQGEFEHEAIIVQPMQHDDGFTIFGFDSWEASHEEKFSAAVTGVIHFTLDRGKSRMGFHENKSRD